MMEGLREWVLSVLAAALLLGMLESCAPKGAVRSVVKLTAGLVLFLVIAVPLQQLLPDWLGQGFSEELDAAAAFSDTLEKSDKTYLETIMSQRTAEYIESKAGEMGAAVTCTVVCSWTEERLPVPDSVTVNGSVTDAQRTALTDCAREQLGIAAEQIYFEEGAP